MARTGRRPYARIAIRLTAALRFYFISRNPVEYGVGTTSFTDRAVANRVYSLLKPRATTPQVIRTRLSASVGRRSREPCYERWADSPRRSAHTIAIVGLFRLP